jgi:hypothetical protein
MLYIKNDNPRSDSETISCNNINNNNILFGDVTTDETILSSDGSKSFCSGNSQSDRINKNDQKADFVNSCVNNNNIKFITTNFNTNNVDNSFSFVHNNSLQQNASFSQTIQCVNSNFSNEGNNNKVF